MEEVLAQYRKLATPDLREALAMLLFAAASDDFRASLPRRGVLSALRFDRVPGERAYEAIINQGSILFYRRQPALRDDYGSSWESLEDLRDGVDANGAIKYRITNANDAIRVTSCAFLT